MRYDLPMMDEQMPAPGTPLMLRLVDIDEDPNQPRQEFDEEALRGLAATIAERGVRQPISVREHPEQADRWMLNFGARRLRASKLAGKTEIPAFVDATVDSYDKVIENEQRDALRPMELALFVQREMESGQSQADVARRLGKSRAYLTYVCALVDAPDWLMALYREGRCRGVRELYDLRRLHESHADAVSGWLKSRAFVSRGDVAALLEALDTASPETVDAPADADLAPTPTGLAATGSLDGHRLAPAADQSQRVRRTRAKSTVELLAELEGIAVRVLLDRLPDDVGEVFVGTGDDVPPKAVAIERLQTLHLVRR